MSQPAHRLLIRVMFTVTAMWLINSSEIAAESNRPNIVFLLVDDLGIKDLSCYGSSFHESPNIDALASEGILYKNAYAAHPVCGPSRSAIVTGKFPARLGLTKVGGAIRKGETIWPKVLQQNGYSTYFLGKWHMGDEESVLKNGFDVNVTGCNIGQPANFYFPYKGTPARQNIRGMDDGNPGDYLTDALTDKALNLLDEHSGSPFLLYFSYYNVHKPAVSNAQGKKEHVEYFKKKLQTIPDTDLTLREDVRGGHTVKSLRAQRNPEYAGQIKALDDSIGRILRKLDELGVADNTIIIFTSDQGSMCTSDIGVSTASPYRFGKGFLFEGGLRVPLIIKWPNHMLAGTTNDTITISTDLYPTLMDMLRLPQNHEQHQDGMSIADTFNGKTRSFDSTLYWAYPHNHTLGHKASVAVRKGPYKLIHWLQNGKTELYNVERDVSESRELSRQHPEITSDLFTLLEDWAPIDKILIKTKEARDLH